LNLNHLATLLAVAERGNITRTARELGTSQPAISRQLAELESSCAVQLLERMPRGVRLTDAGKRLCEHARRIRASAQAAERELAELRGLTRGRLSVGASTTIGSYLIPAVFGEFHRRHGGIELELEIANTAAIQTAVAERELDLGLTEGLIASEQLEVEVVHHDEMVAIVAPSDPLLRDTPVPCERLRPRSFLIRERGSGSRDVVVAALADRGVQLDDAMALGSTEAIKSAVASGLGVSMVSRLAVELELRLGVLVELPLSDLRVRRALHLVRPRGVSPGPAVQAFVGALREVLSR